MRALPKYVAVALTVLLTTWANAAAAQTTINGGNLGNQTWTLANSPYVIKGDATVQSGATLTIEAGVEVRFDSSDLLGSGVDTGRVELIVDGTLDVNGTAAQPVQFVPDSASTSGAWYGLRLLSGTTAATIDHAVIDRATVGLTTEAGATSFAANFLEVKNGSSTGVDIQGGYPTLTDSYIHDNNGTGVNIAASGAATLTRVRSSNNQDGVSVSQNSSTTHDTLIDYATVRDNSDDGIYFGSGGQYGRSLQVRNSIVAKNAGDGIEKYYYSDSTVEITYSDVWANGDDYDDTTGGAGTFSCNPLFVSQSDATLTDHSPARFASDTGTDIGALAYSGTATSGLHGVIWQDTVLTAAASPYQVDGDLRVGAGTTVTLEAGAEIVFASGDTMQCGQDTGRGELQVDGTLVVQGSVSTPAQVHASTSGAGRWWGVDVRDGGSTDIAGLEVFDAEYGLQHNSSNSLELSYSMLHDNATAGVHLRSGHGNLDGVQIYRSNTGLKVDASASVDATNLISVKNADGAYVSQNSSTTRSSTIHSATISDNSDDGVYFGSGGQYGRSLTITNAIITGNAGDGVEKYYYSDSTVDILYSNVWSNGDDYDDTTAGNGCISANPFFADSTNLDYSVTAGSVCIDAGRASGAPDHDFEGNARPVDGDGVGGAAYDMGAYEYGATNTCGDGNIGPGETCDDGANNGAYGYCNATCDGQAAHCGDGTVNGSESCDDGANNGTYGYCNTTCDGQAAYCGDGTVNGSESCDDGSNNGTYGYCNATCDGQAAYCGDGTVNGSETCDDGANNGTAGYCNSTCSGTVADCGDGTVQSGEACDDGSNNGSYGYCASDCSGPGPRCGDGTVNGGEGCDDGNSDNTDACLNTCEVATCGDGYVQTGVEQCDDGNSDNTDACVDQCQAATCGDGYVRAGVEACDDGNTDNDDGCTNQCRAASCGDGVVQGNEECDDGNQSNVDSCLNTCVQASCGDGYQQPGEACDDGNSSDNDACLSTCRNASCGDGIVQEGVEECDDGNGSNFDGCLVTCESNVCGDGYIDPSTEECDDGNTDDGDGCSPVCTIQAGDDAGMPDAGTPDAGSGDAGMADAGSDDASGGDAGMGDAGQADAGSGDAGLADGGNTGEHTNTATGEEGCGCSAGSDSPEPASALYFVIIFAGLVGMRTRRRR